MLAHGLAFPSRAAPPWPSGSVTHGPAAVVWLWRHPHCDDYHPAPASLQLGCPARADAFALPLQSQCLHHPSSRSGFLCSCDRSQLELALLPPSACPCALMKKLCCGLHFLCLSPHVHLGSAAGQPNAAAFEMQSAEHPSHVAPPCLHDYCGSRVMAGEAAQRSRRHFDVHRPEVLQRGSPFHADVWWQLQRPFVLLPPFASASWRARPLAPPLAEASPWLRAPLPPPLAACGAPPPSLAWSPQSSPLETSE
mmetsp:Transcript_28105/g.65296  ORF Transcript_28105/g.65296 Transcript_28105/m.65296 type:complete len:252 (+) Transcript_28105:1114-1869(+)